MDPMELGLVSIGPMARDVADARPCSAPLLGMHCRRLLTISRTFASRIKIGWLGSAGGHGRSSRQFFLLRAGADGARNGRREG